MSQMHFDGPIDVSPELAMALWNAMPAVGQSGVAQMFFSRFVTAPLADSAIAAGAKVFFEREKIGQAGAKALRDGVADKCRALGEKAVNVEQVRAIVDDEMRRAGAEFAKERMASLVSAIPLDALVEAVTPALSDVVRALATQYFTRTQEGQKWILGLIERAKIAEETVLSGEVAEQLGVAADRLVLRNGSRPRKRPKPDGDLTEG